MNDTQDHLHHLPSCMDAPQQKYRNQSFHTGKWTDEEEAYVQGLIEEFQDGHLDLADGTSLRQFLAKMLHCRPKRISKKFEGNNYSQGTKFYKKNPNPPDMEALLQRRARLSQLEQRFKESMKARQMPHELRQELAAAAANRSPPPPAAMLSASKTTATAVGNRDNDLTSPNVLPSLTASMPPSFDRTSSLDRSGMLLSFYQRQMEQQTGGTTAASRGVGTTMSQSTSASFIAAAPMDARAAVAAQHDRNLLHALAGTDRRAALLRAYLMQTPQQQQQLPLPRNFQSLRLLSPSSSNSANVSQASAASSPRLAAGLSPASMAAFLNRAPPLNTHNRIAEWMAMAASPTPVCARTVEPPSAAAGLPSVLAALQHDSQQQSHVGSNHLDHLLQPTSTTDLVAAAGLLGPHSPTVASTAHQFQHHQEERFFRSLATDALKRRLEVGAGSQDAPEHALKVFKTGY